MGGGGTVPASAAAACCITTFYCIPLYSTTSTPPPRGGREGRKGRARMEQGMSLGWDTAITGLSRGWARARQGAGEGQTLHITLCIVRTEWCSFWSISRRHLKVHYPDTQIGVGGLCCDAPSPSQYLLCSCGGRQSGPVVGSPICFCELG